MKIGKEEIPTKFTSNVAGLEARQDYQVINLWEVDVNIVFNQPLPSLLPFVLIRKNSVYYPNKGVKKKFSVYSDRSLL